jgi:predicted GNAT family acetyltransferase
MDIHIDHNLQEQTFYAHVDGEEAELAYSLPEEGVIDFMHTFVPEGLRGRGVGEQLVEAGLAYAREKGWKIIPTCRFVASYVKRHASEYDSLLAQKG